MKEIQTLDVRMCTTSNPCTLPSNESSNIRNNQKILSSSNTSLYLPVRNKHIEKLRTQEPRVVLYRSKSGRNVRLKHPSNFNEMTVLDSHKKPRAPPGNKPTNRQTSVSLPLTISDDMIDDQITYISTKKLNLSPRPEELGEETTCNQIEPQRDSETRALEAQVRKKNLENRRSSFRISDNALAAMGFERQSPLKKVNNQNDEMDIVKELPQDLVANTLSCEKNTMLRSPTHMSKEYLYTPSKDACVPRQVYRFDLWKNIKSRSVPTPKGGQQKSNSIECSQNQSQRDIPMSGDKKTTPEINVQPYSECSMSLDKVQLITKNNDMHKDRGHSPASKVRSNPLHPVSGRSHSPYSEVDRNLSDDENSSYTLHTNLVRSASPTIGSISIWRPRERLSSLTNEREKVKSRHYQWDQSLNSRGDKSNSTTIKERNKPINITTNDSTIRKWKRGNLLGEGTFGKVFQALNTVTGEFFAIKEFPLQTRMNQEEASQWKKMEEEIATMKTLKHKYIVRYKGCYRSNDSFCIFMEYVSGGSIASMLKKYDAFNEELIRRYTRQIVEGVIYLHKMNVVHRDIKGANVLVTHEKGVRLADFGCSKQLSEVMTATARESLCKLRGSIPWMAPEVIHQTGHDFKVDIWSIGATVIEMATAQHPWPDHQDTMSAILAIANCKTTPPIPVTLSQVAKDFLAICFVIDPKKRATALELRQHAFLAS